MSKKYEITKDNYIVPRKDGSEISVPVETHKSLLVDYCVKKEKIETISLKYKLSSSDIERYRRAVGFSRDSIPLSDEEVKEHTEDELAVILVERKARAIERAQDYYVEKIKKDATSWQDFQSGVLKPFEEFKNELKKNSPSPPKINYPKANKDLLWECAIFDAHIGKLAVAIESGDDYNIGIAAKIYSDAIDFSIHNAKNYNIQKIVFPIGQDFLHVDNAKNETTAGTRQDVSGQSFEIFLAARKLLVESIEKLKTVAPVDVVCLVGNHDTNSMFHLGDCIECRYWNDKNVVVHNSPSTRKYYQWGKNLIGYSHGDKTKIGDMALLMATESSELWAKTNYRYWRLGHLHHQKMHVDEQSGVIVEVMPSISATDSWHAGQGYTKSIRGAVSSLFDKKNGLIGKFYYNL